MLKLAILCLCVGSSLALFGFGRTQSVAVKGKLTCNGKPAGQVKIKLFDSEILHDKELQAGKSNDDGTFTLSGKKNEVTTIDPKVNIYHKCNYQGLCFKKLKVKIPKNFITDGPNADKVFDIGELNLAGSFSGESTDCLN